MPKKTPSTTDVRMRGFAERTEVAVAWKWIDGHVVTGKSETVSYTAAYNRVLAADVISPLDVPSFDRSAMDGYALKAAETQGAGDYNPLPFSVIGESLPGQPFQGEVSSGRAVRIMTGAPLPADTDAVLPAEYASESNNQVEITVTVTPGKHVGRKGEDVTAGSSLFHLGRRLRPQDVGLLASVGLEEVIMVRQPRVRLLITGNELIVPGQPRGECQIYESNSSVLCGLLTRDGAVLESLQRIQDDRESICNALKQPGADVILVSGGSSVGQEDHAPSILAAEGELAIHGIAMRPSSPAGMGRIGDAVVFLLPGNPVSCLCAYDFFAGRAIRLLGGRSSDWPYVTRSAVLSRKIVSAIGRVDYCRVAVSGDRVEPLALSGASILSSTTRADGFVIIPAELEGYAPESIVDVLLYDPVC
jgi:molybdopterin molybdotransferase